MSVEKDLALRKNDLCVGRAEEVKRRRQAELLRIGGVVGVGLGTKDGEECINVYVEEDSTTVRASVPPSLDGVATRIVVTGKFQAV